MTTNSIRSDRTHRLLKRKTLLWLALPLTLAAASAVAKDVTYISAPKAAPVSERQAANMVVGLEIYRMWMADRAVNNLSATVDQGVVTLRGTQPTAVERQRINDRIKELAGVTQVKDQLGNEAPAVALNTGG